MRMPTARRRVAWPLAFVALVMLAVLSLRACSSVPTRSTPPGGPTVRATPLANGCPVQYPPANWPAPDVVVTGPGTPPGETMPTPGGARLVSVTHGQRVDFQLASGFTWDVSQPPSPSMLQPTAPAGWYDAPFEACVWGYTAVMAGTTELDFVGSPVCAAGEACPAIAVLARYQVVVR